jgi:hypothetical protein
VAIAPWQESVFFLTRASAPFLGSRLWLQGLKRSLRNNRDRLSLPISQDIAADTVAYGQQLVNATAQKRPILETDPEEAFGYSIKELLNLAGALTMALFRIAAAAGLLFAIAPEPTLRVARAALGMAEEAAAGQGTAADVAINYCKANPQVCLDAARQASGTKPQKP